MFVTGQSAPSYTHAVSIEHDLEHHGRVEGRAALAVVAEPAQERFEIKGIDHVGNEPGQVLLGKPVIQIGGQE